MVGRVRLLKFTDLTDWLTNGLLPTLILILGALLFVRFVQWVGGRYRTNIDQQMRESIEKGLVASEEAKRSRAVAEVIEWSTITVTWIVAALLVIKQLGIPLTTLVAPATVAGVALGFGAQQVVGDLLAGFFLFSERQFGIGDLIRLSQPGSTAGVTGTVEELTLRVTKLRTASGEFVVVPNSALRQVTNLSKDWSRVVLDIPVAATEDLDGATSVLLEAANSMARGPRLGRHAPGRPGGGRGRDDRGRLRAAPAAGADAARSPVRRQPRAPAALRQPPAPGRHRDRAAARRSGLGPVIGRVWGALGRPIGGRDRGALVDRR